MMKLHIFPKITFVSEVIFFFNLNVFTILLLLSIFIMNFYFLNVKYQIIVLHGAFWLTGHFVKHFVVVQSLSHLQLFVTSWTAACPTPLSSTTS